MKSKLYTFLFSLLFIHGIKAQQVPVFIYFGSHNETTDQQFHGLDYNDSTDYMTMKSYVMTFADTIIYYNAKWDMMLESNFILGCLKNENAHTNTNDLIEWADNTSQIEVEVHNHFKPFGAGANPYNYADLCHLLDSCGLSQTPQVMGGFIWRNFTNPTVAEDWTAWQTPQSGFTYPNYTWKPTLLWGGGSPNHIDDYDAFGVWKPQAATVSQFGVHDTSKTLVNFGSGCGSDFVLMDTTDATLLAYRVLNFVDSVNAHYSSTLNAFFNLKIMTNFRHFPSVGYMAKVGQIIRLIQPYLNNGKLQWKSIMEQYSWWQNNHPNPADYFTMTCNNTVTISNATPAIYTGWNEINSANNNFKILSNPFHDKLIISLSTIPINRELKITDILGRNIFTQKMTEQKIEISSAGWQKGIYFLQLGALAVKILKE